MPTSWAQCVAFLPGRLYMNIQYQVENGLIKTILKHLKDINVMLSVVNQRSCDMSFKREPLCSVLLRIKFLSVVTGGLLRIRSVN